jgi:hypothetical protein
MDNFNKMLDFFFLPHNNEQNSKKRSTQAVVRVRAEKGMRKGKVIP